MRGHNNFESPIYEKLYLDAIEDPISFWNSHADDVHWFKKYENTLDDSNINFPKWFTGG
jgi:hypothetical protein